MGSLTDYGENKCVDHVFGTSYTPIATLFLALFTADPTDSGTLTAEADYTGYGRQAVSFGTAASRRITQDTLMTFDQCTAGSNTITHWGIMDGTVEGADDMLAHGQLTSNKIITTGKTPSVASGEVWVEFSTGKISTYLANELLDHMFDNAVYAQPTIYCALVETTEVVDGDDGSTIDEFEMTDYIRKQPGTGWTVTLSAVTNNGIVDWGALTGTGETVTSVALCDNSSTGAGEVLFYDNAQNQQVDSGDTVQYANGAFDLAIS